MQVHQTPTILLTRPQAASEQFAKGLSGAVVVISPLMEIVATDAMITADGIEGVILTSQNAVPFSPRPPRQAYCVGDRTARAARAAGFDVQSVAPNAETLIQSILADPPTGPLLHIHGVHVRGNVAARLTAAGIKARGVAAYDQVARPPDDRFRAALTSPSLIVPLFSPRSATLFVQATAGISKTTRIIALSQAVADALPAKWHDQLHIVPAPNAAEMCIALEQFGVSCN